MDVGQFLARSARTHHDRVAVRFGELSWTYAELADRTLAWPPGCWVSAIAR